MKKYEHLSRLGFVETEGIDEGIVHIFPKVDGTNARFALDENGQIQAGSRNRTLSLEKDNAGFYAWCLERAETLECLVKELADAAEVSPDEITVFGEFLVPHTLKTYRDNAWNDLYIFDVRARDRYMHYDVYREIVDSHGLNYIPVMCTINCPTAEQIQDAVDRNTYLISEDSGVGEGVVLKNYSWVSAFGRQTWAKVVRNEFKDHNAKLFGAAHKDNSGSIEKKIADDSITKALVDKERAKLVNSGVTHRKNLIPALLESVFKCVIDEELYNQLKKHKNAVVDFRRLRQFSAALVKEYSQDLF